MSTPNLRPMITGSVAVGLLMAATFWYTQILPLNQKSAKLTADIKRINQEKLAAQSRMALQSDQLKSVVEEIKKLKEFDLRNSDTFDVLFANRSNRGLIAVTNLLEKHDISIETLSAATVDQHPITIAGVQQGGVLTRKYRILAQGDYSDVQSAFAELSRLPPTVVFDSYDVEAMPVEGQPHARVAFEITFGFNFLVSQPQFDAFTAMASDSAAASGSLATALFDGSLARTIQDRAMSLFGQEEPATPASRSIAAPDAAGGEAPSSGSQTVSSWYAPLENWFCPPAEAKGELPMRTPQTYTFGEQRGNQIGRKEPFLPLVQQKPKARKLTNSASGSVLPVVEKDEVPEPAVTLEGVLLAPGGPATAYMSFDGQRLRVKAGSVLVDGSQVEAIGRDYLLMRRQGRLRRVNLGAPSVTAPGRGGLPGVTAEPAVNLPAQEVTLPPPVPRVAPQP
ncbi:MAG: hypothetical protein VKP72_06535 [bacterium]|nr:hypothetical protein [bacterium]